MDDSVLYTSEGKIGRITLDRAERHNALDLATLQALISAFEASARNGDLCVIFGATGKDFTVGADLKYGQSVLTRPDGMQESLAFLGSFQDLTRAMRSHPGVLIAALHGWVVGGGFEITLSCDLRTATRDTMIRLPELGLGLMFSNGSTQLLPRIVGEGSARQLLFLGEDLPAEAACNMGLINFLADDQDDLERLVQRLAGQLAAKDRAALKLARRLLNENQLADMDAVLDRELNAMIVTGMSDELRERVRALFAHAPHP